MRGNVTFSGLRRTLVIRPTNMLRAGLLRQLTSARAAAHGRHATAWLSTAASNTEANAEMLVQSLSLIGLAHHGSLHVQLSDRAHTTISIIPALNAADFVLEAFKAHDSEAHKQDAFIVHEEPNAAVPSVRITKQDDSDSEYCHLRLVVPHALDLSIAAVRGDVNVGDKIEGNVKIVLGTGDVCVNKLRYVVREACTTHRLTLAVV